MEKEMKIKLEKKKKNESKEQKMVSRNLIVCSIFI